jgi:hypothetical protein
VPGVSNWAQLGHLATGAGQASEGAALGHRFRSSLGESHICASKLMAAGVMSHAKKAQKSHHVTMESPY